MRRALAAFAFTMVGLFGLVASPVPAHAATARNGVCDSGEFCFYYNSNHAGAISDFSSSLGSYGTSQPSCYEFKGGGSGSGACMINNAASYWNRSSIPVVVYSGESYSGRQVAISPGGKANFSTSMKNNNESHLFAHGMACANVVQGNIEPGGYITVYNCAASDAWRFRVDTTTWTYVYVAADHSKTTNFPSGAKLEIQYDY